MHPNLLVQRLSQKTPLLFRHGKMRLVLDDTLCVYHRCRSCGGNLSVRLRNISSRTATATAVGDARQGIVTHPRMAVNDCRYSQVCTDAFSLGFHKGLFLFAKRNSPLCLTAGGEAAAAVPRAAARKCRYSAITSAILAPSSAMSLSGESSTCAPIFPALTQMVSNKMTVSWNTVGNCFFIPTGEQPPWT